MQNSHVAGKAILYTIYALAPSIFVLIAAFSRSDNQSTAAIGFAFIAGLCMGALMLVFSVMQLVTKKQVYKNLAYASFFAIIFLIATPMIFDQFFNS